MFLRSETRSTGLKRLQERAEFGEDWKRFLPEEREEWLDEQKVENGETQTVFDWNLVTCLPIYLYLYLYLCLYL